MESNAFSLRRGTLLCIGYGALFLALWYASVSQWFLPAGLRVAALLFLPRRAWPFLFAGDAMAVLVLRAPKVDQYSLAWAYCSPFLLLPAMALTPLVALKALGERALKPRTLPLVMLAMAIWASVVNAFVNQFMGGPSQEVSIAMFGRYAIGQYLGMLTIGLPVLFWYRRHETGMNWRALGTDASAALVWLVACSIFAQSSEDPVMRQSVMTLMLVPAVVLTTRQGWRGAVVGVAMANVAIGMAMPQSNATGNYDGNVFVAQQVLAVIGTAMVILGARISSSIERADRMLGEAERRAMDMARTNHQLAENDARSRARALTVSQMSIAKGYEGLVGDLKAKGQYELAMKATRQGVINAQLLRDHTSAIYPLGIETEGLYWALESIAFANACGSEISTDLRGGIKRANPDLQLLAYRCICNAVESLPGGSHHIRVRTWNLGAATWISATVEIRLLAGANHDEVTAASAAALLHTRVTTHGGSYRRRHDRVALILGGCSSTISARERPA